MLRLVLILFVFAPTRPHPAVHELYKKAAEQKKRNRVKFDYPEEIDQFSAIYRLEIEPLKTKKMQHRVDRTSTSCVVDLNYYISEWKSNDPRGVHVAIQLFDPNGKLVEDLKTNTKVKEPLTKTFDFNQIGEYVFEITNKSRTVLVLDMAMSLKRCHTIKHKLHKEDIIALATRLQELNKEHTFMVNDNLSNRHSINNAFSMNIKNTQTRLLYSAVLESVAIVVLSIVQAFYMKRLLENKQLI